MPKVEDMLKEILDKIATMEDQLNSLNFTVVQMMGDGSGGTTVPIKKGAIPGAVGQEVKVDLKPLEAKLDSIATKMSASSESEVLETINKNIELLASGKVAKADELITQASSLLEKGLKLTELETALLEIRNQLEQILVELSTKSATLPTQG